MPFRRDMDGRGTLLERATEIRIPALGLFGGADQGIPVAQVEALNQALDSTGVAHKQRRPDLEIRPRHAGASVKVACRPPHVGGGGGGLKILAMLLAESP